MALFNLKKKTHPAHRAADRAPVEKPDVEYAPDSGPYPVRLNGCPMSRGEALARLRRCGLNPDEAVDAITTAHVAAARAAAQTLAVHAQARRAWAGDASYTYRVGDAEPRSRAETLVALEREFRLDHSTAAGLVRAAEEEARARDGLTLAEVAPVAGRPLLLAGPTAAGKTTLLVDLAEQAGGRRVLVPRHASGLRGLLAERGIDHSTVGPGQAANIAGVEEEAPLVLLDEAERLTSLDARCWAELADRHAIALAVAAKASPGERTRHGLTEPLGQAVTGGLAYAVLVGPRGRMRLARAWPGSSALVEDR